MHAHREGHLLQRIALVAVEAPLHRDDRLAAERAAEQPPGVRLHRREREAGDVARTRSTACASISDASAPSPVPRMIATSGRAAEARAHGRRRALDRSTTRAMHGRRRRARVRGAVRCSRVHSLTSDPSQAGEPSRAVARGRGRAGATARRRSRPTSWRSIDHAQLREVGAARAIERRELIFHAADLGARLVEHPLGVGVRLADDELRLPSPPARGSRCAAAAPRSARRSAPCRARGTREAARGSRAPSRRGPG